MKKQKTISDKWHELIDIEDTSTRKNDWNTDFKMPSVERYVRLKSDNRTHTIKGKGYVISDNRTYMLKGKGHVQSDNRTYIIKEKEYAESE